mmetsp:Transcript_22617/g.27974  ORF Transcript_22617/g.27974 Transcript_22617/m.27974 type:complete len:200 (-) Transcript_22617:78-677(-)
MAEGFASDYGTHITIFAHWIDKLLYLGTRRAWSRSLFDAEDAAVSVDLAAAERAAILNSNDEGNDESIQTKSRSKGPDEDHADVELRLPSRVLNANLSGHAHGKAGGKVAETNSEAGAQVCIAGEERVRRLALFGHGDVRRDDDSNNEAENAANTRENDRHDGLHHHLGLNLVAWELRNRSQADRRFPCTIRGTHVAED